MKASTTLIDDILSSGEYLVAECYDLTLATGQTYHFTGWDVPLNAISVITKSGTTGPFNYQTGFTIVRDKITQKAGTEAGNMEVIFAYSDYIQSIPGFTADGSWTADSDVTADAGGYTSGSLPLIAGYTIMQAARYGFLRGATIQLNKLFLNPAIGANTTAVGWFSGTIQDIDVDRFLVHFTCDDFLAYLGNQQMPRLLWQPGCFHQVYDAGCTLLKSAFTVSGTLTSVGDAAHFTASAMTQPTSYFQLGVLTFTSGVNNGVSGPVNSFTNPGAFAMRFPFPVAPAVGDTFTVYPGCDKQLSTCENTNSAIGPPFNNKAHFSGAPFVPVAETIVDGGTDNPPAQTPGATAGTVIGSQISSKTPAGTYKY